MATKTWDGSDSNWRNGNHWSPVGVPGDGDNVVIREGTVHATALDLSAIPIDIGADQPVNDPQLDVRNVLLGKVSVYDQSAVMSGPPCHTRYADVSASGLVVETGPLTVGGFAPEGTGIPGDLQLHLSGNAIFALTGTGLEQADSSFSVSGGPRSSFSNDGSFSDIGGTADFAVPVTGIGTFSVSRSKFPSGTLTFEHGVSAGETVNVEEGGSVNLDEPLKFLGSIREQPFADVVLRNTSFTSSSYNNGVLTVVDGTSLVAALRIESVTRLGFDLTQRGADTVITTPAGSSAAALGVAQSTMNMPVLAQS